MPKTLNSYYTILNSVHTIENLYISAKCDQHFCIKKSAKIDSCKYYSFSTMAMWFIFAVQQPYYSVTYVRYVYSQREVDIWFETQFKLIILM